MLVDWLPWSHTFGGNHNLGQVIAFGGTLHIDDGRPVRSCSTAPSRALRDAPADRLLQRPGGVRAPRRRAWNRTASSRERFLSRLRFMFYAAAALPEALWDRLRALADDVADHDVPLTASWGMTETAPAARRPRTSTTARCGCIGVPLPGVTLKLAPAGDKHEIRLRGPNVTPGYHRNPEATAAAFDDEGYLRTGDAARLVDSQGDPAQGLMFDGRLSEDFKLATGTWVTVGRLRTALVSAAGVLRDAVIAGHDGDYVAALAWVDPAEARRVCGADGTSRSTTPRCATTSCARWRP